jgi:hypothetical protein
MISGTQNIKTGSDAVDNAENNSGSTKHENGTPTPSIPPKMSPGALNMGPDTLYTAKNESGDAIHENGTRRSRYRLKRFRERQT